LILKRQKLVGLTVAGDFQPVKEIETASQTAASTKKPRNKLPAALRPLIGSHRLARLDRMMNTVGELVINRTRMVGRVAELEKLVDTLSFSKERCRAKLNEFQEKYEFNRISNNRAMPASLKNEPTPQMLTSAAAGDTRSGPNSANWKWTVTTISIFVAVDGEISADVNEVLRSSKDSSGASKAISTNSQSWRITCKMKSPPREWCHRHAVFTIVPRRARCRKLHGKHVELDLSGSETELDNNIIQQISDPLVHLVRNSVAHGIEQSVDRVAAGKSPAGNIMLRAYHRGNHIYIEVEDDGGGINYQRVKQSADRTRPGFRRDR